MRASTTLKSGRGWCLPKAILLTACCRVLGIPARLCFADVRNHLSTARMRRRMRTDIFFWHGYAAIYLERKWVKATPAFNIQLCERFGLKPLEFDGCSDSIDHSFDQLGNKHMAYVRYRTEMADLPLDEIRNTFKRYYAACLSSTEADFEQDVIQDSLMIIRALPGFSYSLHPVILCDAQEMELRTAHLLKVFTAQQVYLRIDLHIVKRQAWRLSLFDQHDAAIRAV